MVTRGEHTMSAWNPRSEIKVCKLQQNSLVIWKGASNVRGMRRFSMRSAQCGDSRMEVMESPRGTLW